MDKSESLLLNMEKKWSIAMTESVIKRDPLLPKVWTYEYGVAWKGIEQVWINTSKREYFDYIKDNIDNYVDVQGNIEKYSLEHFNIDHINNGKLFFLLYSQTGDERYMKAACLLRDQLRRHPRTNAGGFWHKKIYPHQMWLDGIYMSSPFYAEFAQTFGEPEAFDDIAGQILMIDSHTKDEKTGLRYHGWDESRQQKWSDPVTGCSPNFWGRSMGWYMMALVDVLDYFPENHARWSDIIQILNSVAAAVVAVQDPATGLWYQVLDQGAREGNYLEASASCMFAYGLSKAARKGYLSDKYSGLAQKAYRGIIEKFVEVDEQGLVNLNKVCAVAGLGGDPYRDGSFEYYINEPVKTNDFKGAGAFILASDEIENNITI